MRHRRAASSGGSPESYDLHAEGDADSKSVGLCSGRPAGRAEPELIARGDVLLLIFADGTVLSGYAP
ncbi:hypothetical protein [Streptomyces sp. NBC_00154]|uniref:hypothetical protein n=1 Tax=Streptomyces sp. NBC_00154 TaxID=2975670 RepID=UPI0022553F34|nr:hypothetical protein [Streptomyces sp. NBC_00154]MCX5310624.1 hypothetical protein [Streptomyces sp. NBC_00154]